MAPIRTYTATSWRDGASWAVRVAQLDRTTRAARLSDVDAAARRLIATLTEDDPEQVRVIVDPRVPEGLSRLLEAAAAARQESDLVSVEAVAYRRTLARRLSDHGYGIREIAVLLGVSTPRATQLVGDPVEPQLSWPQPPSAQSSPSLSSSQFCSARSSGAESSSARLSSRESSSSDSSWSEPSWWGPSWPRRGPTAAPTAKPHGSYQHEAFLYRNLEEFLAGTVPFVQDAVRLDQTVMVALIRPRLELVRNALGPDAEKVIFVDMAEFGRNPARILAGWLGFVEEHGGAGRPIRGIGEPQRAGRRPEERVECQLHEGLLNVAIDPDLPLWLRCPYDLAALPGPLIEAALHSHPALVEVGNYRGSPSYGGLHLVDSIFRSKLPAPPADHLRLDFGAAELPAVRAQVTRSAIDAGIGADRSRAMTSAVSEVATRSVDHGSGRGELRIWTREDALVCEVSDTAVLDSPLVGRLTPPPDQQRGRGLWLANQLSDLVQIRSSSQGSVVRIFAWLQP